MLVIFFVFGFGMGNVIAPASTVMQNALPLARAGAGSAVQNTVRQVFGALGVAVIGTVLATQYAKNVQPVLEQAPAGTPPEAVDAATNSVGGTVARARRPRGQGRAGRTRGAGQGRSRSTRSSRPSHVTGLISTVLVLVAALVVWFLLPPITPPQKGAHGGRRPAPRACTSTPHVGAAHDACRGER